MTKADIINIVAGNTGVDRSDVHLIFDGICDTIKNAMTLGNNIQIRGFGSFINKKRAKKIGRNISTNTSIVIAPHFIPVFKPCKTFVHLVKTSPVFEEKI